MKLSVLTGLTYLLGLANSMPVASKNVTSLQIESLQKISNYHQTLQVSDLPENATEDGLSGPCKPVTMIFAKGTFEDGNVGDGASPGPALIAQMRKTYGADKIAVQGVPYAAGVEGQVNHFSLTMQLRYLLGGDPEGSERFLNLTNQASVNCPNTRFIISGYSQGAQLAHNAAKNFSPDVTSRVDAAVVFGDPKQTEPIGNIPPNKVLSICHDGDIICKYSGGAAAHLNYSQDAVLAASFVTKMFTLSACATAT
ncbi:hypothetical protein EPUL_000326 [Erysiphe pulchra]|uniref:cutinase n=1 Tax=Erysiphe pulchra TaxID=225359 RepID=A0A2S4Q1I8_9PEZI|nr:hypothetical protein EPUL_000326 [Erysiphe pulchra]